MQSETLDNKIAALEQEIQDVVAAISKAETKAEKAEAEGNSVELNYWRNEKAQLREEKRQLRDEKARVEVQRQAQRGVPDSSWSDCAKMLGGLPEVPRTIDDFQQYLQTGAVALTPSFHSRLVAACPVQDYTFAAASEGSILAQSMTPLVSNYESAADNNEEVTGQYMTAFTAGIWRLLRKHAPVGSEFEYTLRMDRNKRPSESMTDVSTTLGSTRPDLIVIIDRLLMFVGEEKAGNVGRHRALYDIMSKIGALSPLFYQDIPYIPVYAAAGDEIQFGLVLANGKVEMSRRVFKLTDVAHRVQCLAASVALYRLFASLLKLAPVMDRRAALFFPFARPHSTFITYIPGKNGAGDVVRKEIFDFANYADEFNLDLLVLQRAYEVANSSVHMVHASRIPRLRRRLHPDLLELQQAYFVQLTTLGCPRTIDSWTLSDLQAATYAVIQAAAVLHSHSLVHADLRAANILWRHGKPFLTDLEQVHKAGFEAKDIEFVSWTRNTRDENGCYTELSDMEQIGVLMHAWEKALSKRLQGPARDLMERLRTKNLTAHAAALHPWFSVSPE